MEIPRVKKKKHLFSGILFSDLLTLFMPAHARNYGTGGFTLVELLLSIAIIAGITVAIIHPAAQLGKARDTERLNEINTILNAVYQYTIDQTTNSNMALLAIPTATTQVCKSTAVSCNRGVSLNMLSQSGRYIIDIPYDPQSEAGTGTNYWILRTSIGRITVTAPGAEEATSLSVTR
jgi:prepilin-type N-terminal cleavage/methylation domain-containing protein